MDNNITAENKEDLPVEYYKELLDNLPIGVVQISKEQTLEYFSKTARKLVKLDESAELGMPVLDFIAEEYHELFRKQFAVIQDGNSLKATEYILKRTDGSRFFAEISTYGQVDGKSGFGGVFVAFNDITGKKQIETELKNSETRFRSIFENANIAMTVANNEGKILMCNQAFIDLIGYTKDELLKMSFKDFSHPDDYDKDRFYYTSLMKGEIDKYRIEKRYIRKNGNVVEGLLAVSFVRNEAEELLYSVRMLEDITDRKKAEKALRESERRSKTLVNNLPGIVYRIRNDETWSVEYVSDGCYELCGYIPEDFYNNSKINFWELTYPDDRIPLKKEVMLGLNSKTRYQMNYRIITSDGKIKWVWEQGQGVVADDGSVIALEGFITDITERMNSILSLLESEQKYRTLVENIYDALSVRDLKGNLLYANDKFLKLFAITENDLAAFSRREFLSEEAARMIDDEYKKIIVKKISGSTLEFPAINRNGDNLWIELRIVPVFDNNNSVSAFQNILMDITDRKKYEAALKESEEKYRTLFENIITAFVLTEAIYQNGTLIDFKYLDVNPAYEQITGVKKDRVIGKFSNEVSTEEVVFWLETYSEILSTGKPKSFIKYIHALDKYFYFWLFSPAKDRMATFFVDVTGQKIAEERLKASEQRFRSYFELPLIGIAIFSTQLKWLECNDRVLSLLGYSREELLQKTYIDVAHPDDKGDAEKYRLMIENKIDRYTKVKRFIRKDGTTVHAEIAVGCLRSADGSVSFLVVLIEDITEKVQLAEEVEKHRSHLETLVEERTKELAEVNKLLQFEIEKQKEAEEKVIRALEKEKEVSELKSRFISFASHEFRTPLTTIYSSTQLLERYGRRWDEEMYQNQITRIKENIHHLTNTMDDVLIIGRTETGKIKFEPKELDLKAFCGRIADDIKGMLNRNHQFIFNETFKHTKYLFDEKLLKYILLNLLSNAIKYSPNGGRIQFNAAEEENKIVFTICDDGIGIPVNDQQILFEPFHRGNNVGEINGTGLGMSIVKRSVEMHEGSINFKSTENEGTTFTITIPAESKQP